MEYQEAQKHLITIQLINVRVAHREGTILRSEEKRETTAISKLLTELLGRKPTPIEVYEAIFR